MKLLLESIAALSDDEYRLVFSEANGRQVVVICTVSMNGDIGYVQPEPDIFIDNRADSRATAASVLAFRRVRIAYHR